jgi:hypothetical protein
VKQVKENKNFPIKDNGYDIKLESEFYYAETIFKACAKIRLNNEMENTEYRRR